jgi:ectoine hydroxylase
MTRRGAAGLDGIAPTLGLTFREALDDFDRQGYCCLRGALSRREVRALREAAFEVAADAPADSWGEHGALHHLGAAYAHPRFGDLVTDARMVALVATALTPNIHVYHSHLDIHPPEPPSEAWRWHEDGGRMTADLDVRARLSVKVGYFLSDLEDEGFGNLMVIPGSHRWRDPLPRTPGRQPKRATPILARAGDAVLLDRRVWHSRSTNSSERTRIVVFFGYAPRWIVQREVAPEGLLDYEGDPVRRQILGSSNWDPCHVAKGELPVTAVMDSGAAPNSVRRLGPVD